MKGLKQENLRIRDPIHDLITFDLEDPLDDLAWELINSREFQRLRRVKQLGFSDFVFPGATHTRFSHCLGAFSIARKLLKIIEKKQSVTFDKPKAFVAGIAALLHDLGHGPFSHVFEGIQKDLGRGRKHEEWTREMIEGDTEVHSILERNNSGLANKVGLLLGRKDPADIYDALVSSQFDADRLDYLQRDRYMTGTNTGAFDYAWLLDCLEIGKINVGQKGGDFVEVDGLYLNHKGLAAAEGYLLARFHLYSQIYLHKTTRAAELMLASLPSRMSALVKEGHAGATGLHTGHPLLRFFEAEKSNLGSYVDLDDSQIWSGIAEMAAATDAPTKSLSIGLRDRKLHKCINVGEMIRQRGGDSLVHFKRLLKENSEKGKLGENILKDEVWLTAYGTHDYEDPEAFQKVLIGLPDGRKEDIARCSEIVGAIPRQRIFRVYFSEPAELELIEKLLKEVIK